MKIEKYTKDLTLKNMIIMIFSAITFYMLLANLESVRAFIGNIYRAFSPLVTAFALSYVMLPLCHFFEQKVFGKLKKRKTARNLAVVSSIVTLLVFFVLLIVMVVPQLVGSITSIVENMDSYLTSANEVVAKLGNWFPESGLDSNTFVESSSQVFTLLLDWVTKNIDEILQASLGIGTGIFNGIVILTLVIYILIDRSNILNAAKRYLKSVTNEKQYKRTSEILAQSDVILSNYLSMNFVDALVVFGLNLVFMLVTGMPYAMLISVIAGVTNIIPTFGPWIGAVPNLFLLFIVNPNYVIIFLIWTIILQIADGNVIKPILFNGSTGLRPLYVLSAILIGGRLFGMLGLVLGTPVVAIIAFVVKERVAKRIDRRNSIELEIVDQIEK